MKHSCFDMLILVLCLAAMSALPASGGEPASADQESSKSKAAAAKQEKTHSWRHSAGARNPEREAWVTTSSVAMTPAEREALNRWLDKYFSAYKKWEEGQFELKQLSKRLQQERAKRENALFNPMRSHYVESLMQQMHKANDEGIQNRERLQEMSKYLPIPRPRLLAVVRETLERWDARLEALRSPDQRKSPEKEKGKESQGPPDLGARINALYNLEYQLIRDDPERPAMQALFRNNGQINQAFFGQLANRLDRIDSTLEQLRAVTENSEDAPDFLINLTYMIFDEEAAESNHPNRNH
ncbi:MAG: hypothetical protein NTX50_15490 [Candidatus Sumerlaeota bacterium]|nr:hypothetical protein [Candidatus Sumerlaeota bacterium]